MVLTLHLCVVYGSHNKQRLLPHTTFTDCGNKMPTGCNRRFLSQILLLAQHVSGTIMPITRNSRVLYRWLLPGIWFFGFQVVGMVWSWGLCVQFAGCSAVALQPANMLSNRRFLLQILLLAQHVSGTIMPITRNSRVLYRWLLPVVFGSLVFKLSVWCGAEGCVSSLLAVALLRYSPQTCW